MKIVTWNVNSLKVRLPRLLELLGEHAPDVVCMQETKCEARPFPRDELSAAGYHAVHHSAGRWAGVAIVARGELELSDPAIGLPGESHADEARWIEATVGALRIVSTYVPNGRAVGSPTYAEKLDFLDAAEQRVARCARRRTACRRRRLQRRPPTSTSTTRRRSRDDPRDARRALARRGDPRRRRSCRRLPRAASRRAAVHVVGLSPGALPSRHGAADRSRARLARARGLTRATSASNATTARARSPPITPRWRSSWAEDGRGGFGRRLRRAVRGDVSGRAATLRAMPPLITRDEALRLGELADHGEIEALVELAWRVRKENFAHSTDLCSLVNAKSGGCAQDCGFWRNRVSPTPPRRCTR